MIFGEACLIDPDNGKSRGSIITDTPCEIFVLHKTQIQTFPVDDDFLSCVKGIIIKIHIIISRYIYS